jgi:hypothetical protein
MAEVTGSITGSDGTKDVQLNNAATEATLKLLLQSNLTANKQSIENIKALAQKSGLDPASIAAANANIQKVGQSGSKLGTAFEAVGYSVGLASSAFKETADLTAKFANGTAQASDVFAAFSKLPFGVGLVAQAFSKLSSIQEQNFKTYQQLTTAGVSFGGSLTELRLAAANTYMTLDGFATLMKNNSASFTQIGGSVNAGAVAFSKFSHDILSSGVGTQLMSLGYTAEEANQGMITYLAASGISNAKDLASNAALRAGAAEYLEELDRLADTTGKSRKEQEDIMKKQQLDAEIQMTAARMAPADRAKFEQNVKYMTMMYGDAGKDMALAQAQHRSVVTKEGQTLAAIAPGMQDAMEKMAKAQVGSKEYLDAQNEMSLAAQQGLNAIPLAAYSTNDSLKKLSQAQLTVAGQEKAGLTTRESLNARDKKIADDKAERERSQAAAMAATSQAFSQLGADLWAAFSPALEVFTPLIKSLGEFATYLSGIVKESPKLALAVTAMVAGFGVWTAWKLKEMATASATGVVEKLTGAGGKGGASSEAGSIAGGVGKGAGAGMKGIASGLRAFANPQVMLGAVGFGVAIAAVGAGIAGAAWLTGKALPTLAEGLMKFTELDGGKLGAAALGTGKLGLSVLTFAPFAVFGLPAGLAMNLLADGIVKLNSVDPAKLEKVAIAMQKVKDATPSIGQSISAGIAGLVGKVTGTAEPAAAAAPTTAAGPEANPANNLSTEIKTLNKTMTDLLKYMKETADNTRRNYDATRALDGNLFARP